MMLRCLALFSVLVAMAQGANDHSALRERITQSLEQALEAHGIENCENKCEKAFNRLAYQISAADGRRTFEFRACVQGCNQCVQDLANNAPKDNCFKTCKDFDWKTNGLVKGVIEPDKACMGGCVINTCQVICAGGTVDPPSATNRQFFYPNGGCSIKTEPYSQFFEYVPWNSPVGQGGEDSPAADCCANALSLCDYVGDETSENFLQLLANTAKRCSSFAPSGTQEEICAFFNNPQNCGGTV